jgi:hypothetical protein
MLVAIFNYVGNGVLYTFCQYEAQITRFVLKNVFGSTGAYGGAVG